MTRGQTGSPSLRGGVKAIRPLLRLTFIGPRDITFHRDLDIVSGTVVLRDLELECVDRL